MISTQYLFKTSNDNTVITEGDDGLAELATSGVMSIIKLVMRTTKAETEAKIRDKERKDKSSIDNSQATGYNHVDEKEFVNNYFNNKTY